tara:strand:- start:93 stop:482 length:390 start_codon:yes stop_codon:yes gene_type:complete
MIPDHAHSIYLEFIGKRNTATADLKIYTKVPVGVGDHSDIGKEIKKKLREIDKYHSLITTMEGVFPSIEHGPIKEPTLTPEQRATSDEQPPTPQQPPPEPDPEPKLEDSELSDSIKVVGQFRENTNRQS